MQLVQQNIREDIGHNFTGWRLPEETREAWAQWATQVPLKDLQQAIRMICTVKGHAKERHHCTCRSRALLVPILTPVRNYLHGRKSCTASRFSHHLSSHAKCSQSFLTRVSLHRGGAHDGYFQAVNGSFIFCGPWVRCSCGSAAVSIENCCHRLHPSHDASPPPGIARVCKTESALARQRASGVIML